MVLGFRITHGWHRGSVLPRIATQRSVDQRGADERIDAEFRVVPREA